MATVTDWLLNLTITERALQPTQPVIDQPVEFIQVSANTRTPLPPHQDRVTKLRGVELHHFAAFYKSSCVRLMGDAGRQRLAGTSCSTRGGFWP